MITYRFEGMKAYRQEDGTVRLFRPDKNMERMNRVSSLLRVLPSMWANMRRVLLVLLCLYVLVSASE
jgi:branched-subunit amino acid aminotransferase/4-amino-4-deoxychorismate lyase